MLQIKPTLIPKTFEAFFVTGIIICLISFSIIQWNATPHIPMIGAIVLLWIYGFIKKVPIEKMERGMIEGAKSGFGAIYLFFLIGILIASWIVSGTIPTIIYTAFHLVTPKFYYSVVFVITAIIGVAIGSSLTTVASIGIAFISVSEIFGLSLPITAGAIVSGAFFGDKMSPLSDTTNLASGMMKVDLFDHIRNLSWTTIPAFFISAILFAFLSPSIVPSDFENIDRMVAVLRDTDLVHLYSWLPLLLLFIFSVRKRPAIVSISASAASGLVISFFHLNLNGSEVVQLLFSGYMSNTGNVELDSMLSRGGIEGMFFTISLLILALSMGGLLFTLGIIPKLFSTFHDRLHSFRTVIAASSFTAMFINIFVGEQYLSILLTGKTYEQQFEKVGLARKNLSRILEDAGTVINPLVPWSVCGVFISNVLHVEVIHYLPFAFFCLLSPVLTLIFGVSGKTLTFL
ncbi:Na+/H+ antiporter NhaC [Fervidibacillus halotolerans]|uniref:Na+/H+ antiporter NhaC n=1 Tax=Fervidibacillus halotolerans TaxID=2980027 RepID=A0A9E8M1X8_9BACI|nr:Na+/H+ antiporter NhaC [Fervidibacillus halotolerans]WAA12926.1 Na+/H+ antiporter NhaC [Fervidibacillus halotolerans]